MRNKISNSILGLIFIVVGIGFLGNTIWDWNFTIFFDGWWTLFIIVPCFYSIIRSGANVGNLIGIGVGGILLLRAQDIIEYNTARKIILPAIFIFIGISIIFQGYKTNKHKEVKLIQDGKSPNATAIFGGTQPNFDNSEFSGINCSAIFGGVDLNLRRAIISQDCVIRCDAIFGGVEILLPTNVKLKIEVTPILGGTESKYVSSAEPNAPTVYVRGTCICGGIEIK